MAVDYKKIYELAEKYKPDMTKFLRDMIAIPSESCNEKDVVLRIKKEMEKAARDLDFMEAARLRDEMFSLQKKLEEMKK